MPLLSVLLPAKDAEHTIREAVRSTLYAMPRDAELVVLDDGSRVPQSGVLADIIDRRLVIRRNEASVGVGAALQQLLEGTDSRFVGRMDADDVSLPARFTLQLRQLRKPVDLVFAPIVRFPAGRWRLQPSLPAPIVPAAVPLHLLVNNPLCHPTLTARREALVAVGGYRPVLAEDYDLLLRALTAGLLVGRGPIPVLGYRQHPGQLSRPEAFRRAAMDEAPLRESYITFCREVFGVEPDWLDALWSDESGTPRMAEQLAPLRRVVERGQRHLSPVQRAILQHTVGLLDARDAGGRGRVIER